MFRKLLNHPFRLFIVIVVLLAGAAVAWWLGSPLFLNRAVDEAFPLSANATLPPDTTQAQAEATMSSAAAATAEAAEEMPVGMTAAQELRTGNFRDADSFHRGSGQAIIYQLEDGTRVLRLENFRVTNGPQLHVYLAAHNNPISSVDVHGGSGYIDLGPLKGNIGSQNYVIPADVDLSLYNSIVIYCVPFSVVFSVAPLMTPTA